MKIDASRFTQFWANPDRYRLREVWKLAPEEAKVGTFASLLTYGRRRGTAFHEILDAAHRGVSEAEAVQSLKDGGFDEKPIEAAKRMAARVRELYPNETYLLHESVFEYQLPSSPHVLTGRVDHVFERDGEVLIGDWKTTKHRTKKDFANLVANYCGGPQVGFYLLGVRSLGFTPTRFLYRVVQDRRSSKSPGISITEHFTERSGFELRRLERDVHITCELIEWMKQTFGVENSWPCLYEPFDRGYGSILGRKMYSGYTPDGFTEKIEHLSTMMQDEDEPEEDDAA